MQEYKLKKAYKIAYLCSGIILCALMAYCMIYGETFAVVSLALVMFGWGALMSAAVFYDRLVLSPDFIEVKRCFISKRINIHEIVNVAVFHNQAFINSERTKIHITQDFINWREVVDELIRKVNQRRMNINPPSKHLFGGQRSRRTF